MKKTTLAAFALALSALALPALAHDYKLGALEIDHPWARATPGAARNGAAYLKIENKGATADRLIGAEAAVAATVELHTHVHEGGVMKMRPSGPIDVPAHGAATLQPGGLHVMLIGLKAPLKEGDRFPLTLVFEKAGKLALEIQVEAVGAGASQPMGHAPQGHAPQGQDQQHGHGMKKN